MVQKDYKYPTKREQKRRNKAIKELWNEGYSAIELGEMYELSRMRIYQILEGVDK